MTGSQVLLSEHMHGRVSESSGTPLPESWETLRTAHKKCYLTIDHMLAGVGLEWILMNYCIETRVVLLTFVSWLYSGP